LRSPPLNHSLWKSTLSQWVPCLVWETLYLVVAPIILTDVNHMPHN
jgi:hypothetical protein